MKRNVLGALGASVLLLILTTATSLSSVKKPQYYLMTTNTLICDTVDEVKEIIAYHEKGVDLPTSLQLVDGCGVSGFDVPVTIEEVGKQETSKGEYTLSKVTVPGYEDKPQYTSTGFKKKERDF